MASTVSIWSSTQRMSRGISCTVGDGVGAAIIRSPIVVDKLYYNIMHYNDFREYRSCAPSPFEYLFYGIPY